MRQSMHEHFIEGCSISELSLIFRKDRRTVTQRLRNCKASGERRGHPVYDLAEACRHLTFPMFDVEAHLRQADPKNVLPSTLKEFWTGQIAKQMFETNEANLWPAEDVKAMFFDVYEKLESGIRSFAGNIDAHTELSDKQRGLLKELSTGLRVQLRRTLVDGDIERIKPVRRKVEDIPESESDDDGL